MAESPIQSSFIPSDAAAPAKKVVHRGGLYDLLMLISIVMFVASAVIAAVVFLYVQFLTTQSASKRAQLERAKAAFEPALIQKLIRLDDRMHVADDLLTAHIAPSILFTLLEQSTLQTVAYLNFNFQGDGQQTTMKMTGTAQSVNSIALQADLFSKSSLITSPIFSNIDRQPDGVHFAIGALINPALMRYSTLVTGGDTTGQTAQSTPATTQGTGSPFTGTAANTNTTTNNPSNNPPVPGVPSGTR
jgi:hypothetical protein